MARYLDVHPVDQHRAGRGDGRRRRADRLPHRLVLRPGLPTREPTFILPATKEVLDHVIDAVVDAGDCGTEPTTVVDWSEGHPEVVRLGSGDAGRFR